MYYLELEFTVSDYGTTDELDGHLDDVLNSLHDDERVSDPDYLAELSTGDITISVNVDISEPADALNIALGAIRAAIHSAEGATPGWEAHFDHAATRIRKATLIPA